jgi:prophage antirepressor-like protein
MDKTFVFVTLIGLVSERQIQFESVFFVYKTLFLMILIVNLQYNNNAMIQIYENKPIEVLCDEKGDAFFKAQEIFKALGLTWRNTNESLRKRGIENSEIRRGANLTPLDNQHVGIHDAVYVSEIAMYKLVFRSNKPEANKFTHWAASVIKELREKGTYSIASPIVMKKHNSTECQKENSKKINSKNYMQGGVDQTVEYNRKNMILHTGKTPSEIKKIGIERGLKKSECSSGKEVVRRLRPDIAAGMSFTDSLVNEDGIQHEKAVKLSLEFGVPLFKALLDAGIKQERLTQ